MFLSDAQLAAEIARCEYCETKPCKGMCPSDCSPADFIMAARHGQPSDYRRAAAMIMAANPLGGVCGAVCPDRHCMRGCARAGLDRAIDIPAVQAAIIERARRLGVMPELAQAPGHGPASRGGRRRTGGIRRRGRAGPGGGRCRRSRGRTAARRHGAAHPGGPSHPRGAARRPRLRDGARRRHGEDRRRDRRPGVAAGGTATTPWSSPPAWRGRSASGSRARISRSRPASWLGEPGTHTLAGRRVAVVGGGAVAADCAVLAAERGAVHVELLRPREALGDAADRQGAARADCRRCARFRPHARTRDPGSRRGDRRSSGLRRWRCRPACRSTRATSPT